MLIYCGLIVLMAFRDKVVFLSSRAEQYVPTLLCFGLFTNFVDMIIAAKIFIVIIWMGAGFSKFNHGFSSTVAIMVQNTPWVVWDKFRKATVKDYPNDIRPSNVTHALAHIGGTTAELVMPLVLLVLAVAVGHVDRHRLASGCCTPSSSPPSRWRCRSSGTCSSSSSSRSCSPTSTPATVTR